MSQSRQNPAPEQPAGEQQRAPGASMLLSLQAASPEGVPPPAPRPKSKFAAQSQNVITALVIVISAGLLFAMRQIGMGSGVAEAEEVVIHYQPVNVDPAKRAAQERALAGLQRMSVPMPLEPGTFNLTPFLTKAQEEAPQNTDDPELAAALEKKRREEAARKAEEEKKAALVTQFSKLQLHSILDGKTPVARIGEDVVRVGDLIDETFTVVSIQNRQVVLEAGGQTFTLTQEETGPDKGGKKPKHR
jgi:FKBP-type peptidyl-prolyl cis-trans isomerase